MLWEIVDYCMWLAGRDVSMYVNVFWGRNETTCHKSTQMEDCMQLPIPACPSLPTLRESQMPALVGSRWHSLHHSCVVCDILWAEWDVDLSALFNIWKSGCSQHPVSWGIMESALIVIYCSGSGTTRLNLKIIADKDCWGPIFSPRVNKSEYLN